MDSALIFDIQRFSLHDGPGIRTTVFFKGCPLRCAWCQNPESWAPGPEIAFYEHLCRQCFNCLTVCAEQAILQQADQRVDYARCTACGKCADACVDDALRLVGRAWTVADLVAELLKDEDYFKESGGGVTLSGGEPLLQAGFLKVLLPELKSRQIHVTLETCGLFNWRGAQGLLPFLDLVYYDLKMMAAEQHNRFTGTDNRFVLANFTRFSKTDIVLQARMPVIPGINDHEANIRDTAGFLLENKQASIHLLPYHNMGEAKISRLHTDQKSLNLDSQTPGDLERVKALFAASGIEATIYD